MRNVPETIHCYKIPRLNWIFVFFSLLFVASMAWMIWFDYIGYRKWKGYQKEFQVIEAAKLTKEIKEADLKATQYGLDQLKQEIEDQKKLIDASKGKLDEEKAKAEITRVKYEKKDTDFKFRKADYDAQKYNHDVAFEELKEHPGSHEAKSKYLTQKALLDKMKADAANLEKDAQEAEKVYKADLARIDQIVGEKAALEKELSVRLTKRNLMEKKRELLTDPLIQNVVNAPFLEITEPTIRVKQIELEDHRLNMNFADVPRVDRCISCHVGISKRDPATGDGAVPKGHPTPEEIKKGNFRFADLPQPFAAHPKLDVFVGDSSPHPVDKFGCTPCHWGWDRGMDFSSSAHMPDEEKMVKVSFTEKGKTVTKEILQKDAWLEKYHWHEMHHAEQKMRPSSFIESSCLKCHTGQTHYPQAEKLEHGVRLIEQAGCFNCHKMRQLETFVTHKVAEGEDLHAVARLLSSDTGLIREANGLKTDEVKVGMELSVPVRTLTKTGPSLYKISSKLDKDWVRRWLAEPKKFRPNSFMPQFWGLEKSYVRLTNMNENIIYRGVTGIEVKMEERDAVEIEALTDFVFALSDDPKPAAPPVAGDVERGKQLVANAGCFACHVVNERLEKDQHYTDGTPVDDKKFPLLALGSVKLPSLDDAQYKRSRSQGPMLFGSGSKMEANWLYSWLKDPKQYHATTKMPNLRLSDQEASDIASYLATLRNEEFEKTPLPKTGESRFKDVRNDMVQEYLEGEYSKTEAKEIMDNGAFDAKAADFFRRIKYSDVNDLISRWRALAVAVNGFKGDISEPDRRHFKAISERLALDMRARAKEFAAAAPLLTAWADQLPALTAKVIDWNNQDEKGRKETVVGLQLAISAAEKGFEDLAKSQAGKLDLETKKKLYAGEKLMTRYGCYSCHNVRGFDSAKPIGAELSVWGNKLTSQLDYGYLEGKVEHSNYAYVQHKMKAPRSFDKTDVKKPQEWLKMPQFNLTEEQRKEIAIVIMGMTEEKVLPQSRKTLTENDWQIENGRWIVKELNCVGCHIVEKKGGAILATLDAAQKQMWPPNLQGLGTKLKPTWLYHFLQDPGENKYRYWVNVRMPTFGFSDEQINTLTRYFALLDKQTYPFEADALQAHYTPQKENVTAGQQIYEKFQCLKCHQVRPSEMAARASNIGPDMKVVKARMRPKGIVTWLRDPAVVTPGVNMPANWPTEVDGQNPLPNVLGGITEKQIQAVTDYLLTYDGSIEAKHPLPKEEPAPAGGGAKSDYE